MMRRVVEIHHKTKRYGKVFAALACGHIKLVPSWSPIGAVTDCEKCAKEQAELEEHAKGYDPKDDYRK